MSRKKKEPQELNLRGYEITDISQPSDDTLILNLNHVAGFTVAIKITAGCHGIDEDSYLIIEKVIRKEVVQKVTESEPVILI